MDLRLWTLFSSLVLVATLAAPPPPEHSPPTLTFTVNERAEQDRVWKEIDKRCVGCWSGAIAHYDVTKHGRLVQQAGTQKHNFRLKVEIDKTTGSGIWSVYNIMKIGDDRSFPISRIPDTEIISHKLGFDRIIVRATKRDIVYIEIGFWDNRNKRGDTMRRTVVASYVDEDPGRRLFGVLPRTNDRLQGISILQQKFLGMNPKDFQGGSKVTDDGNLDVMPDEAPTRLNEMNLNDLTAVKVETIDLSTYERQSITNLDASQADEIYKSILEPLKVEKDFTRVMQNGIYMSVPKKIAKKGIDRFIFAQQWEDGMFQVVEIVYSMQPWVSSSKITVYSFQR
jgi:hypothetical protein